MSLLHDDLFSVRGKVMASDSWDGLLKDTGGRMSQFVQVGNGRNTMTKSASECFSREFINSVKPDDKHFLVHYIAMGAHEKYGCVSADTPITMYDGRYLPIVDVNVGDIVLSGHGNARAVTSVFEYDLDAAIKVRIGGICRDIVASPGHPFMVAKKQQFICARDKYKRCLPPTYGEQNICLRYDGCQKNSEEFQEVSPSYVFAKDLCLNDFLVYKIPSVKAEEQLSEAEATIIGYWLAEGSFIRNKVNREANALSFAFDAAEIPTFVESLRIAAEQEGWNFNLYGPYADYPNTVQVHLTGRPERSRIYETWFGSGAHSKRIPIWFHGLPKMVLAKLVKAYMEGDAAITDTEQACATTVSLSLALGMQALLWNLNIAATSLYYEVEPNPVGVVKSGFKGYRVNYAYSRVPDDLEFLRFGHVVNLKQLTKVHLFILDDKVYLPIRALEELEWNDKIYTLEVAEDHSYVSTNVWSKNSNRNGDSFVRDELMRKHATFVSHGAYFKEHKNHDKKYAIGTIKASAYNRAMDRVEVLVEGDKEKAASEYEKAKKGDELSGSMATRIPHDVCSICQHKAARTSLYCDHAKHHMTRYLPEFGKYAFVFNPDPTFIDYSSVARPADRIAHYIAYHFVGGNELQKAASETTVITSSDWAEYYGQGLVNRQVEVALEKLAAACLELNDPQSVMCATVKAAFIRDVVFNAQPQELTDAEIDGLRRLRPATLWHNLAKRACVMPFRTFCAYLLNKPIADIQSDLEIKAASAMLLELPEQLKSACDSEFMRKMLGQFMPCCGADADSDPEHDDVIDNILEKADDKFSVEPVPVHDRVIHVSVIKHAAQDINTILLPGDAFAVTLAKAFCVYKCAALATIDEFRGPSPGRDLLIAALA